MLKTRLPGHSSGPPLSAAVRTVSWCAGMWAPLAAMMVACVQGRVRGGVRGRVQGEVWGCLFSWGRWGGDFEAHGVFQSALYTGVFH